MNRDALRQRVAGVVGDSELIFGVAMGSDLKAVADRGVKLFHLRIELHACGGVDSIANQ